MKIEEVVRGDVVVVRPKGRLTVETEEELREAVRRLFDAGWTRLVLDLASVRFIDSCGLGAIIHGYISARRRGGGLKLLNVSRHNVHLLAITKLLTVFETFDSEDEAIRSYSPKGSRQQPKVSSLTEGPMLS
jgi:anti-sigma B factor antagonist